MKTLHLPDGIGHESCNKTIDELVQVVAAQRALLESTLESLNRANQTISILNHLMALRPTASIAKRGRGRPAKRVDDSGLLDFFNSTMLPEFLAENPNAKCTDSAVLTWFFTKEHARHGWSASRVRSKVFQGKLKTLKNRLGDARNPVVKLPVK